MSNAKEPLTAQEMQKRSAVARWGKYTRAQRTEMMRELARRTAASRRKALRENQSD